MTRPTRPLRRRLDRELAAAFDLSVFPCADCGRPSVTEHYDRLAERLVKLCRRCKESR